MACSAKVLEALELDCESLAAFCLYNLRNMAQEPRISSFERVRARALRVHAVGRQAPRELAPEHDGSLMQDAW